MRYCFVLAIVLGGCLDLGGSQSSVEGEGGDEGGGEGCKIEGGQIGQGGVVLRLGAKTVTFDGWVAKDGEPSEYVGFSLTLRGGSSVSYVVKAGTEQFPSTSMTWLHPAGTEGSQAHGISNVDMCDDPDAGGGGDGGGDGGGGDGGPIIL